MSFCCLLAGHCSLLWEWGVPWTRDQADRMNVGVAHSDSNPNHSVYNSKGIWITYLLLIFLVHLLILSVPFFSVAIAWTLTNVLHDIVSIHSKEKDSARNNNLSLFLPLPPPNFTLDKVRKSCFFVLESVLRACMWVSDSCC